MKTRFQFSSVIIEVSAHPQDKKVLLTVSKERFDEDAVQVSIPRHGAAAIGALLRGVEP